MTNDRTILITGVTGNQGCAVAQDLQGSGFRLWYFVFAIMTVSFGRRNGTPRSGSHCCSPLIGICSR